MENQVGETVEGTLEKALENTSEEKSEITIEKDIEGQAEEFGEDAEVSVVEPIEKEEEEPLEESFEKETVEQSVGENENLAEKETEKPMKNNRKIVISVVISFCTLIAIYFGMAKYFSNRFYFGSEINSISVSGKTVGEVETLMASELQKYTLNLKERGGKNEQIKASEVGLMYNSDGEIKKLKESQNPFNWILACLTVKGTKMTVKLSYDEKLLKEQIDKLSCFDSSNVIEPKNPSFQYKDNSYVIVNEVQGNRVDKDVLYSHVAKAMLRKEAEVDLESVNCYIKPEYDSNSQRVLEARDTLNKYVSSKITYTIGGSKEVLDGSTINKWLKVDENLKVIVDEERAMDYVEWLSKTYNTVGKTRNFVTSSGRTINIGGGDYGRSINKAKETQNLISAIKEGKSMSREPSFNQTAPSYGASDIGNTYVEIDLSKQHMWFYKNGTLIVEGDVVTGNVSAGHATPKGVYKLKYKQRNAVLRGPDYEAPVTFWMPFNGGIGIHDASWRSTFGGNIYKTNGSHGCINSPYSVAKKIFDNIDAGTPVICY